MKLRTDFHDYYDTAVGFGIDEKAHYDRFTRVAGKRLKFKRDFPRFSFDIKPSLLGFRGELYPLIEIVRRDADYKKIDSFNAYTYEEFAAERAAWDDARNHFHYEDKQRKAAPKRFFERLASAGRYDFSVK